MVSRAGWKESRWRERCLGDGQFAEAGIENCLRFGGKLAESAFVDEVRWREGCVGNTIIPSLASRFARLALVSRFARLARYKLPHASRNKCVLKASHNGLLPVLTWRDKPVGRYRMSLNPAF